MSLGEQIFNARKAKKMTQADLAEAIGVSTESVSKWEQDKYVPSPDRMKKLKEVLRVFQCHGSLLICRPRAVYPGNGQL